VWRRIVGKATSTDVAQAEALIGSDKIKPVVADFDRV
jgi:hypothetical protein